MTNIPAPWQGDGENQPNTRRNRRHGRQRDLANAREQRWQRHRLAVPYRTDGPKVTFGVLWFAAIMLAAASSPFVVAVVASTVAAVAGLQVGYAWFPNTASTYWWTATAALVCGIAGSLGPVGLLVGCGLAVAILGAYLSTNPPYSRTNLEFFDVLARAALPVGIAAGSLTALAEVGLGAMVSLILLVSAYEVGDFLVGSGSSNAVEGPISGVVGLAAMLFILWLVAPAPLTSSSVLLLGALTAVCCPLGQILASAILPRGNSWAPALRRLDSYLLAAPLWLVLIKLTPTTSTL